MCIESIAPAPTKRGKIKGWCHLSQERVIESSFVKM